MPSGMVFYFDLLHTSVTTEILLVCATLFLTLKMGSQAECLN